MVALAAAFFVIVLLAGFSNTVALSQLSWLTFFLFPLLIVILIAALAHVQQRINLKSLGVAQAIDSPSSFTSPDEALDEPR